MSDIHRKKGDHKHVKDKEEYEESENSADYNAGLPVVAFTLSDDFKKDYPHVKQESVSNLLRAKQYIIPSNIPLYPLYLLWLTIPDYPLPPNEEKTEILRVVVRESLSLDMIDRLVTDICHVTETLVKSDTADLAVWQPSTTSVEKEHASSGLKAEHKHKARRPMQEGVHRSVC